MKKPEMSLFTIDIADGECGHTVHLVKHDIKFPDLVKLVYDFLPIEKLFIKKYGDSYVDLLVTHSSQTDEKWEYEYRVTITEKQGNEIHYRIQRYDSESGYYHLGYFVTVTNKGKINRKECKTLQKFELLHERHV